MEPPQMKCLWKSIASCALPLVEVSKAGPLLAWIVAVHWVGSGSSLTTVLKTCQCLGLPAVTIDLSLVVVRWKGAGRTMFWTRTWSRMSLVDMPDMAHAKSSSEQRATTRYSQSLRRRPSTLRPSTCPTCPPGKTEGCTLLYVAYTKESTRGQRNGCCKFTSGFDAADGSREHQDLLATSCCKWVLICNVSI